MTSELFQRLEQLLATQSEQSSDAASMLTSLDVPSASIAVLTSSGIISHTIANSSSPADPATLFQACSISKPIFGLAILRTVDQGKLSLTDPITKHLPSKYIDAISTPLTRHLLEYVTIRDLASHTAGVTVGGFPGYDPDGYIPDLAIILAGAPGTNTPQIRLNRLPELKWRYAGGGTTINQAVLESIHQKPLPEIVEELVFKPLGMDRSFYRLPEGEKNYAQCWVTGVTEVRGPRWHVLAEQGAAGIWTTPTDLLKAVRGIRDAAEGKSEFLKQETAIIGLKALEGANGVSSGGWQSEKGWVGHGGANHPGYRCRLQAVYDNKDGGSSLGNALGEGVAVMTNSALGNDAVDRLIQAIAYLRGWPGRDILALHVNSAPSIPLNDVNGEVSEAWKDCKGKWRVTVAEGDRTVKKDQMLEILEDSDQHPTMKFTEMPALRLLKAAIPAVEFKKPGKQGIDLVVEGLDMMLSFGYDEQGKQTLEVWPGADEGSLKCERV